MKRKRESLFLQRIHISGDSALDDLRDPSSACHGKLRWLHRGQLSRHHLNIIKNKYI